MSKFLIDENLSPLLAKYLRSLKYDAISVRDIGLRGKSDEDLIGWIQKEGAIIITCDSDFGEFFYWQTLGNFGVIILRSKSQKYKSYKEILQFLHREKVLRKRSLEFSLLVATKRRYRLRKFGD